MGLGEKFVISYLSIVNCHLRKVLKNSTRAVIAAGKQNLRRMTRRIIRVTVHDFQKVNHDDTTSTT